MLRGSQRGEHSLEQMSRVVVYHDHRDIDLSVGLLSFLCDHDGSVPTIKRGPLKFLERVARRLNAAWLNCGRHDASAKLCAPKARQGKSEPLPHRTDRLMRAH